MGRSHTPQNLSGKTSQSPEKRGLRKREKEKKKKERQEPQDSGGGSWLHLYLRALQGSSLPTTRAPTLMVIPQYMVAVIIVSSLAVNFFLFMVLVYCSVLGDLNLPLSSRAFVFVAAPSV